MIENMVNVRLELLQNAYEALMRYETKPDYLMTSQDNRQAEDAIEGLKAAINGNASQNNIEK